MTTPMFKSVRPIVKATHPELYAEHTFHMKKCVAYTYNYSYLDDYIAEHWNNKSIKQIALETNEYEPRVAYRSKVLQSVGIIQPCLLYTSPSPRDMRRSRMPSSA